MAGVLAKDNVSTDLFQWIQDYSACIQTSSILISIKKALIDSKQNCNYVHSRLGNNWLMFIVRRLLTNSYYMSWKLVLISFKAAMIWVPLDAPVLI